MPSLPYSYTFDFSQGLGAWSTWMHPSVIDPSPGSADPGYVRLQAPGTLDPNHIDGIGSLSLIAHLSASALGSPGAFDLRDAEIQLVIRGHDFDAHGAKLVFWICSTLPDGQASYSYPVGVQITNWANTGNDLAGEITNDWQTITVRLDTDAADWTAAGNYQSTQDDWAERYQPLDLRTALAHVDATLHLVAISDSPANRPTGFLDLASITVRTAAPATYTRTAPAVTVHGDEDATATGTVASPADRAGTTYSVVAGSAHGGSVTLSASTGAFSFAPDADFYGSATFQYMRVANGIASSPLTAQVQVIPRNDAPVTASVTENLTIGPDAPFAFTLMKGSDADGDRLTFQVVAGSVAHGALSLDAATGRYTFTPEAGYTGTAGFAYVVSDGQATSAPKTVSLQVASQAPVLPSFGDVIGTYFATDMAAFVRYTILLAGKGDPSAAFHYGEWLTTGNWVVQDTADAARYLRLGLGASDDAALELAQLYIAGDGVTRDYGEARTLLASIPNSAAGVFRLAMLTYLGLGGPADHAAAASGFLAAAEMGYGDAMATIGRRYLVGDGIGTSAEDAYFWLKLALRSGSAQSTDGFVQVLEADLAQAATKLSAARIATLDAGAQSWTPGQTIPGIVLSGNGVLVGTHGADHLTGGAQADYLIGSDGADVLSGGIGLPNTLQGGRGDDLYLVAAKGDSIVEFAGEGVDTVYTALRTFTLPANVENLVGTAALVQSLSGNALDNVITGGLAADVLNGLAGDDVLIGGDGAANTLQGGAGNDTYYVSAIGDSVVEAAGGGNDTVRTALARYTLRTNVENLVHLGSGNFLGIGNAADNVIVGGDGDDVLNGGAGADSLIGGGGNDVLIGGDGANELQGGAGDDTYHVSVAGDSVIEAPGEGKDTVRTALGFYALGDNVENLVYTGTAAFVGLGGATDNVITGGAGDDTLNGQEGNDTLVGFGGNDVLIGGAGADTLQGGAGNDTYYVSTAQTSIIEAAGEGFDAVRTDLDFYTLPANVEALVYTGAGAFRGVGSAGDDLIVGGGGADELYGNAGADTLAGGDGADYLFGDDGNDLLNGGAGNDRLTGGEGADQFVLADAGMDTITDFAGGSDRISLDHLLFTSLGTGELAAGAFVIGTAAANAASRIIYDPNSGALLYDPDGLGGQAAVQIAVVSVPSGVLTAADFLVI